MRIAFLALIVALTSAACSPQAPTQRTPAQKSPEPQTALTFMDRIAALQPSREAEAACRHVLSESATLNGPTLFHGSAACMHSGRKVDGAFLLSAAQIRSLADMGAAYAGGAKPAGEEGRAVTALYGAIYSYFGGPGPSEVFRDPAVRAELMGRIENWQPRTPADYNPGWPPVAFSRDSAQRELAEMKSHRVKQLDEFGRLMADDAYYAASEELDALKLALNGPFVAGTPAFTRSQELLGIMNARSDLLLGRR